MVALALALVSGFLFGIVPVRQVMRAHPYEVVKAGATGKMGRRVTMRDVLLVAQIAICALLVTASLVAVRGLVRSVNASYRLRAAQHHAGGCEPGFGGIHGTSRFRNSIAG